MSEPLHFTGERFMPGLAGEIGYEHWHRYVVARRFCEAKTVLDVACGEGYGSHMLAAVANHVTGVDISEDAVAHATGQYGGRENLEFIQGDCEKLPLPDNSVDVAVSLETIEHLEAQEAFVGELRRVLKPGGLLVMSSPNK
ncbi:MAG: class I SAM-dependent methyltransferase, partial [Lysobacterales bacterium]